MVAHNEHLIKQQRQSFPRNVKELRCGSYSFGGSSWRMFAVPPLTLLIISIFTVAIHTAKKALSNPVNALPVECTGYLTAEVTREIWPPFSKLLRVDGR